MKDLWPFERRLRDKNDSILSLATIFRRIQRIIIEADLWGFSLLSASMARDDGRIRTIGDNTRSPSRVEAFYERVVPFTGVPN